MDPATITPSTFILSSGNIIAPGSVIVSPDGTTATLTISTGSLSPNITYTARITTGVRNSNGTPLGAEFTWTFSTGTQTVQSTAPQVVSTARPPVLGVDVATVVSAIFNRVMDPATGDSQTFTVSSARERLGTRNIDKRRDRHLHADRRPDAQYVYTATVTTGFKRDTAGIPLATDFSWSFTTAQIAGTTPPVVTAIPYATGATGCPDQLVSYV
jgi:hypothetical protein